MSKRIFMLGAGAVGGYVGGRLSNAGYDVTLVDFWHENLQAIRSNGLELSGMTADQLTVARPKTMNLHEISKLAPGSVDIAVVSVKSYDTAWITTLIKPYLSPTGYVVSLQNCINEETIAEIVGWGKVVGCIASRISVELFEPGRIRRQAPKGAAEHTVFRVGEVHGRITPRIQLLTDMLSVIDGSKVTTNLWGERWSKLCHNTMRNGISAATGLGGRQIDFIDHIRRLTILLGAEAVTIGQALGYELERIGKLDPDAIVRAATGDQEALEEIEKVLIHESSGTGRGELQRPSMGQDMVKGRRTEIDELNGFVVKKGEQIGISAPYNSRLCNLVKRVERGEIDASAQNISESWISDSALHSSASAIAKA